MCGIFAYLNVNTKRSTREIINILLSGLQRVEYRGYDGAGICVDSADQQTPVVIRCVGNIQSLRVTALEQPHEGLNLDGHVTLNHVGLAHTRWATHGAPCERNGHPQFSNGKEFIIVHNGIITNFMPLKMLLLKEGYTFQSDTDTEVIAVLAEYLYTKKAMNDKTFAELAAELAALLDGAYAILMTSKYYPNEIVACRKGSPLLVAVKQDGRNRVPAKGYQPVYPDRPAEIYFGSDSNSFIEHTNNVAYLEDNDIVHFKNGELLFYTAKEALHSTVSREFMQIENTLEALTKGSYPDFMLKEIYEQSESVVNSMRGRVDFADNKVHLGGLCVANLRAMLCARRIVFTSCGTSYNSCLAVRPLMEELLPMPICVEGASDFLDRESSVRRDDVFVFVSQSGETADTLLVMDYCRKNGAILVGVTNVVGSSISRLTDFGTHLNAGAEVGVASTKAYTSQIIVLTLMALILAEDSLRNRHRCIEIIQGLAGLSSAVSQCLNTVHSVIKKLAERVKDKLSLIVLGRGYHYATAMEAALKVKEITYIHTEGINCSELKHGPLALIDENATIFAICTEDKHYSKTKVAIQQVHARKGKVIALATSTDDAELVAATEEIIVVPRTVDCLQCIINIIPFQLLAYEIALLRGNNVDCPRNLAKSVTVQ